MNPFSVFMITDFARSYTKTGLLFRTSLPQERRLGTGHPSNHFIKFGTILGRKSQCILHFSVCSSITCMLIFRVLHHVVDISFCVGNLGNCIGVCSLNIWLNQQIAGTTSLVHSWNHDLGLFVLWVLEKKVRWSCVRMESWSFWRRRRSSTRIHRRRCDRPCHRAKNALLWSC